MTEITEEKIQEVKTKQKPKALSDAQKIEKLEKDVRQIKALLHKMKTAIGLPESLMPDID